MLIPLIRMKVKWRRTVTFTLNSNFSLPGWKRQIISYATVFLCSVQYFSAWCNFPTFFFLRNSQGSVKSCWFRLKRKRVKLWMSHSDTDSNICLSTRWLQPEGDAAKTLQNFSGNVFSRRVKSKKWTWKEIKCDLLFQNKSIAEITLIVYPIKSLVQSSSDGKY